MIDIEKYIYVQDQLSNLKQLLINKQDLYQKYFYIPLERFYDHIYNIFTATSDGVDIWGSILGVPKSYKVKIESDPVEWLGFSSNRENFSNGTFGKRDDNGEITIILKDKRYKECVLLNAFTFFSNTSTKILSIACNIVYNGQVIDNSNMSIQYSIDIPLDNNIVILSNAGYFFPRPTGVKISNIIFNNALYSGIYTHNGTINYNFTS